jgi:hypothetical protein
MRRKVNDVDTLRRATKRDEVKREDVVCKGKSTRSKRNDAQRNETREAEYKGIHEPQPRVARARRAIVTKEDESATIRNDAVENEIECGET